MRVKKNSPFAQNITEKIEYFGIGSYKISPSKTDVKVSFHQAQVGTSNKNNERRSCFQIIESPYPQL